MAQRKRKPNKGSFRKGHPGGPGRPRRIVLPDYLNAVPGSCSLADWKRIVKQAVKDAIAGNHKARDFLAKYLAPVPDRVEVSGVGGGPIETTARAEDLDHLSEEELETRFLAKCREHGIRTAHQTAAAGGYPAPNPPAKRVPAAAAAGLAGQRTSRRTIRREA